MINFIQGSESIEINAFPLVTNCCPSMTIHFFTRAPVKQSKAFPSPPHPS